MSCHSKLRSNMQFIIVWKVSWYGWDKIHFHNQKLIYTYHLYSIKTLDSDDFKGEYCNNGPYPLLNAVVKTSLNYTNSSCPSSRNIDSTSILDASNTTSSTLTTTSVQIDTTQPIETTLAILNVETTTNPPNGMKYTLLSFLTNSVYFGLFFLKLRYFMQ